MAGAETLECLDQFETSTADYECVDKSGNASDTAREKRRNQLKVQELVETNRGLKVELTVERGKCAALEEELRKTKDLNDNLKSKNKTLEDGNNKLKDDLLNSQSLCLKLWETIKANDAQIATLIEQNKKQMTTIKELKEDTSKLHSKHNDTLQKIDNEKKQLIKEHDKAVGNLQSTNDEYLKDVDKKHREHLTKIKRDNALKQNQLITEYDNKLKASDLEYQNFKRATETTEKRYDKALVQSQNKFEDLELKVQSIQQQLQSNRYCITDRKSSEGSQTTVPPRQGELTVPQSINRRQVLPEIQKKTSTYRSSLGQY